jgi:Endonuclease NucS
MDLMLNISALTERQEDFLLEYTSVYLKCPHCETVGCIPPYARNKHLFKYVGAKNNRHLEASNFNGYCECCNGKFRMSNGVTIKRTKHWVEIKDNWQQIITIGCLMCGRLALFLPLMGFNMWLWIVFTSLMLAIATYLSFCYKNVELSESNRQHVADFLTIQDLNKLQIQNESLYKEKHNLIAVVQNHEQEMRQLVKQKQLQEIYLQNQLTFGDNTEKIFNSERELQNYLHKNIDKLNFNGRKLSLYPNGFEFAAHEVGYIDLLCIDDLGNFCIIETKVDRISDKVIGQISRYMGWVDTHLNKHKKKVYGLVIGLNHNIKLKYAAKLNENIFVFEYKLGFKRID